MLIISQNTEFWVVQSPFGIPTLCTIFIDIFTVFIRGVVKIRWSLRTCFLAFGNSLGCFSATVFFPFFCFADPVAVSLLALVLTLYGCSLDFVDPRLLNFHLRPELPESESAELRKEVQQVVAAGMRR